jgi:endonuclease YncB( thermonuclease family)
LASAFLENAINTAEQVVIRTELKDSRGKYGRVLGSVICDGKDINVDMIDNYMAVKYFGQSKEAVEAVHMSNRTRLIELGVFTPDE